MTDSFTSCYSQERLSTHTAYDESPEERIKLSQHLNNLTINSPKSSESLSLDFSHKSIDEIDFIISPSSSFQKYQTFIGNGNYLTNLRNIEQFSALKKLSLADNEIEDLDNIYYLAHLTHLSELNLIGNPITEHSGYKDIVIMLLPNLKVLDSEEITEDRRKQIPAAILANFVLIGNLLTKQLYIIKLESIIGRLKMHQSLYITDFRFRLNHIHFDTDKCLQIVNLTHILDESFRIWLRKSLLKSLKIDPEKAFTSKKLEFRGNQLLFKQSQLLIKLLKDLERTSLCLSDLTKNSLNISDIRGMDSKSESDSQSFYSLNMDGECWETCQSNDPNLMSNLKIPQAPEIISEKEIECSFNEMNKPGTPSFRLDISQVSENEEGHFEPSNISHVENSVWQDITIKHVTSSRDPPKTAVLKDKDIQLKDLVLNATQKSSAFKRRTIKNKERASSRREYEAIIDIINKDSSSHVRNLEKQIQNLKEENYALCEENKGFKSMAEEENYLVQQENQAGEMYRKRIGQQAFFLLRYSVKCSKEVKTIEGKVLARRRLQLEKICFDILARERKIWKKVKAREVKSRRELLKKSFDGLKSVFALENKLKNEREKRIRNMLKGYFGYWKNDYMKESSSKKEQTKKIQRFVLQKSFRSVQTALKKSIHLTKRIQEMRKVQDNSNLKKYFASLKTHIIHKKSQKEKEQIIIKKRLNNAWISLIVLEQNNRIAEELSLKKFRKNRLRRMFDLWKQNLQKHRFLKEFIEERQRKIERNMLNRGLVKLKDNITESLKKKYKESCEENQALKKKEEQYLAQIQNQESELKRILEEYTLKLQELQQKEQIWAKKEQKYQANEALYKEKESSYSQKDQDYALIEEMYHQKDLEYLLRDQEWQTREELHKAREDMFLEREEALKAQEEALQARENKLQEQEKSLRHKEEEILVQEFEQNEQNKAKDIEHAIREQELIIKEELFKTKEEEYERKTQEYIEKDLALTEREKENEIKFQEFSKKEEHIMKKQIGLVQIKKEAQEVKMRNEEEFMRKEEEWALKEKEYVLKEALYAQKEEEIMKKDQENTLLSEKYNQLKAEYEERETLFLQVREEIQEACVLKEEEYAEKEGVLTERIEEYAQKEDEYQRKIRNYQENEKTLHDLEEENKVLREELQTVKQQYIESSNHQINASNAILEEMETYKQDLQGEKEAKEALFNEKESLIQEIAGLNESKERSEIIIQELENLCMKLQEALDAKNSINSARKSQSTLLMQINEQEEEMEEPKVERDLNKELEDLEDESGAYDSSLQVEEMLKNKLEESKREIELPNKFLSTDPNSHYNAVFTSQTEGDLREYIHILDFSRQKTEEGSLVYMGRPTFDPQSNGLGTTIKNLDDGFEVRTPANSGKIQRRVITRYDKENLLGSPPVRLVEPKESIIKAEPQGNFMRLGRANSLPWNIEAGLGNPLGVKSPNMENGAGRKDVGKIKTNRKKELGNDPLKNIESLRRNTQSIYDEIQLKAKRRQTELRYHL